MASAPVDIPVQVKGLSDLQKLERRMQALEKEVTRLQNVTPKAANGIRNFGASARGAAGGVKAFSASIKAALGPIAPFLAAVAGVGAAFNTIKNQDFAEAKFASLGGDADQLVTNLKAVSNELQGTASVAELTGAAYDVASAGFSSAAEASQVLKAASLGATGGFAELNTVANATTSVLNAYQLSAADASKVVDQFIQTQNDGKIVVAEYAANIGKVASAAAGLGVPLSEVNAVIAQATASGVQAEVAFTGLKGALARLANGEATKALEGTGIEIDAASVKADGLFGTLKKLEGLDTGQIFKALGTEAGPALLPVIQNLEKYEELLLNQERANGVAAAAAATASGTIQGAWRRVTVAFENLFADQSELGQLIRGSLLAAAATVEALAAAFKVVIAPIRAVIEFIGQIAQAMTGVKDAETILQSFTALWFQGLQRVQEFADTVIAVGRVLGQYIGALVQKVSGWFSGLFSGIATAAQGVVEPIVNAFANAFRFVKGLIDGFIAVLPPWLKDALGGVGDNITGVINKVLADVKNAKKEVQINVPGDGQQSNSGGATGGVTGAGSATDTLQQQLKAGQELAQQFERRKALLLAENDLQKSLLKNDYERLDLEKRIKETAAASQQEALLAEAAELAQIQRKQAIAKFGEDALKQADNLIDKTNQQIEGDARRQELIAEGINPALADSLVAIEQQFEPVKKILDEKILTLETTIEQFRAEGKVTEELEKQLNLIKQKRQEVEGSEGDAKGNAKANEDPGKIQQYMDQLETDLNDTEGMIVSLAQTVESELGNAMSSAIIGIIDGTKTAEEAFADMFKNIGKAFIDMATQMIAKALVMKALGILTGGFGGGSPFGSGASAPISKIPFSAGGIGYAGGGYTGDGPRSGGLDGQGGFMAMLHPQETVVDHSQAHRKYSGGNEEMAAMSDRPMKIQYQSTTIAGQNYVTEEEFRAGMAMATKEGAATGERRVFASLRNSRSRRSQVGL